MSSSRVSSLLERNLCCPCELRLVILYFCIFVEDGFGDRMRQDAHRGSRLPKESNGFQMTEEAPPEKKNVIGSRES